MYKILTNRLGENLEKSFKKTKDAPCAPAAQVSKILAPIYNGQTKARAPKFSI